MKHSLNRVSNLPNLVYGAAALAERVDRDTGDRATAMNAGKAALGVMAASFNRQQEVEADRVGTELMSAAKYDPEGMPRLMSAMVKMFGAQPTGYLDNHPGWEERIARAGPTVLNQRFDGVAASLAEQKNWKTLSGIVNHWLKVSPDSARAWYYKGAVLAGTKQEGALEAFERAVAYDPNFEAGQLALCVALYSAGRELESLICSERVPRGEALEHYQANTFQHNVYVSGMHGFRYITALDVAIVQAVMRNRKKKPE
jgi:predicted Zn-dependent protease